MRVIIDTNRLQADELRAFLAMSPAHRAVLTDYTAVESFKGDALINIQNNMAVLRDFPGQTIVLAATGRNVCTNPALAAMGDRMIDKEQTRALPDFFRTIDRASAGNQSIQAQLRLRGTWANQRLDTMTGQQPDFRGIIEEIAGNFSEADLRLIRAEKAWPRSVQQVILTMVVELADAAFDTAPAEARRPRVHDRWNHFIYRQSLCHIIHLVLLMRKGTRDRKPETVRNDLIDQILATYATYFNGLMSDDFQIHNVHWLTTKILRDLGARVPPDYTNWVLRLDSALE